MEPLEEHPILSGSFFSKISSIVDTPYFSRKLLDTQLIYATAVRPPITAAYPSVGSLPKVPSSIAHLAGAPFTNDNDTLGSWKI